MAQTPAFDSLFFWLSKPYNGFLEWGGERGGKVPPNGGILRWASVALALLAEKPFSHPQKRLPPLEASFRVSACVGV